MPPRQFKKEMRLARFWAQFKQLEVKVGLPTKFMGMALYELLWEMETLYPHSSLV